LPAGRAALSENFNRFDAGLCDAWPELLFADLFTAEAGILAFFVFARTADLVLTVLGVAVLEVFLTVFLRDFLDIRLPFVAFGGSTIGVLRVLSVVPESATVQV
jgi:hypothetical protein